MLYDTIQSGVMGVMTVGTHRKMCVTKMMEAINFF